MWSWGIGQKIACITALIAIPLVTVSAQEIAAESDLHLPSSAVLSKSLEAKCLERMEQLTRIEKENSDSIAWEVSPVAVRGTYIGFAPKYGCSLGAAHGNEPTGTLRYQEVTYEKSGKSVDAAQAQVARPIEINEITEIFVYRDGAWR